MELVDSSTVSLRLSAILKVAGISLHFIDLGGKRLSHVKNIVCLMHADEYEHEQLTVGSAAEGISMQCSNEHSSDVDFIIVINVFKILEDIREVKYVYDFNPDLSYFLRLPDYTNPGYSKLLVLRILGHLRKYCDIRDNKVFLKNTVKETLFVLEKKFQTKFSIHGPALTTDVSSWNTEFAFTPPTDLLEKNDTVFLFERR
ncbi:unnamed protein product [Mytilus edulis]|uniref:Uncharacterized protein n=1 Tax=Mytilus edulis TaxID=6550 RepID=A0A8S3V0D9_MYTED|nr:unnamed protein product [Mytilus edulis]